MTDRFARSRGCIYLIQAMCGGHVFAVEAIRGGRAEAEARACRLQAYVEELERRHDACWDYINHVLGAANPPPPTAYAENAEAFAARSAAMFAEVSRWLGEHGLPSDVHDLLFNLQPGESVSFRTVEVPFAPAS